MFLYAKPQVHLEDVWLRVGLEEDNSTGTLSIRLLLEGEEQSAAIHCEITHPVQGTLYSGPLELCRKDRYRCS